MPVSPTKKGDDFPPNHFLITTKSSENDLTLDDVGGLPDQVAKLRNYAIFIQRYRENNYEFDWNGKLLLVGPPGTGKTLSAKAFAGQLKWDCYEISTSRLITSYLGETGVRLDSIFEYIKEEASDALKKEGKGVILFVDELDFLSASRESNDMGEAKRIVVALLTLLERNLFSKTGILTIAATNHPHLLDYAAWSRFDLYLEFPVPDEVGRTEITARLLQKYIRAGFQFSPSTEMFAAHIAKNPQIQGFSGRDLRSLIQDIIQSAVINKISIIDVSMVNGLTENNKYVTAFQHKDVSETQSKVNQVTSMVHDTIPTHTFEKLTRLALTQKVNQVAFKEIARTFIQLPADAREALTKIDFYFLREKDPLTTIDEMIAGKE